MKEQYYKELNRESMIINPGEYYVSGKDEVITTLLGSCVATCLFDPVAKVIGMNHFLLSSKRYAKNKAYYQTDAGRYGTHAMELLINQMLKAGAVRKRLEAKAFGGGNILALNDKTNFSCVSEVNVRFIKEFLEFEKIPLTSQDLGGDTGRIVHFIQKDFTVLVRKLDPINAENVVNKDKIHWKNTIRKDVKESSFSLFR